MKPDFQIIQGDCREMARRRIMDPEPEAEIQDVDGQMRFEEIPA